MSRPWLVVVLAGAVTMVIKGAAPLLLGARPIPERWRSVLVMMAPALLAALVVTQAFTSGQRLTVDARTVGLGAAVLGIWRGLPTPMVIGAAVVITAAVRFFGG